MSGKNSTIGRIVGSSIFQTIWRSGLLFVATTALATTAVSSTNEANVSYETLTFINGDGHSYVNYATTRSEVDNYTVFLDKAENLSDYLYINPNRYEFDETDAQSNKLSFDQGSYAMISQGDYINASAPEKSALKVSKEGTYALRTWNGEKQSNGHYGIWNTPDPFARFAAAWVLPEQFELINFTSNRPGEWVQRGNTLAFFAHNVNNVVFDITYQRVSQPTFSAIRAQLASNDAVDIENDGENLKVILTNEILFASGSASLTANGLSVITEMVAGLTALGEIEVIVEGHTDNVPIRGSLKNRFPTNWELSAERALSVVHALSKAGVNPKKLQARAFGPYKPRVPNDNAINRSTNRRIELIIAPT